MMFINIYWHFIGYLSLAAITYLRGVVESHNWNKTKLRGLQHLTNGGEKIFLEISSSIQIQNGRPTDLNIIHMMQSVFVFSFTE